MENNTVPKQFLRIASTPIIIRTINAFFKLKEVERIIITISPLWEEYCQELLTEYGFDLNRIRLVHGGNSRFESLINLVNECYRDNALNDAIVITHDCARPFVSCEILKNNITAIAHFDMVTTSVPTIDTVLISKDQLSGSYVPNRHEVFLDQGPQTLHIKSFLDLVQSLTVEERLKYIEAGRLYMDKGLSVGIVKGERTNFKITTELDLRYAEFLIHSGEIKE